MVILALIISNCFWVYLFIKLYFKYTDAQRDSGLKTHYFDQLSDHMWSNAVFMDSDGNMSAPGGGESKEILAHWNKYHEITMNFKGINKNV
jgi:hypothetical protein